MLVPARRRGPKPLGVLVSRRRLWHHMSDGRSQNGSSLDYGAASAAKQEGGVVLFSVDYAPLAVTSLSPSKTLPNSFAMIEKLVTLVGIALDASGKTIASLVVRPFPAIAWVGRSQNVSDIGGVATLSPQSRNDHRVSFC